MNRKRFSLIVILTTILTLCSGTFTVCAAEGSTINYTSATVNIGDEDDALVLEMQNAEGTGKRPRWVSWNENVAKVEQEGDKGIVTPLRKGKAIISSGIGFPRQVCVVTVVEPSMKLDKKAVTLYSGGESTTVMLKPTIKGADNDKTHIRWSSSNKEIATVDSAGKVTAVAAGEAVITAQANGMSTSCEVTVKKTALSLNLSEMTLGTRGTGSSVKLQPTVVGAGKKVIWTSDHPEIARVAGGKVTGRQTGDAKITATANGVSATCDVHVKDTLLSISEEKILLYTVDMDDNSQRDKKTLKTNKGKSEKVTWVSSDPAVASVDENGTVTALKAGTAVITASSDGKEADTCIVEVKQTVTDIKEHVVSLKTKGNAKTYALHYEVIGRKPKVTWKLEGEKAGSIAKVSSKGVITAKKEGTVTVTATANGVTDKVKVRVETYKPTIELNQSEYVLYTNKGNTVRLKATADGPTKKVTWESSNKDVATVKNGTVTAQKPGKTTITATANGLTAKCFIQVKESQVRLGKNFLYLDKVGDTFTLTTDVIGASQTVSYKSGNSKIATVTKNGLITAKKNGKTIITVKANNVQATCEVVVGACEGGHDWQIVEADSSAATCLEDAVTMSECSKCHARKQDELENSALGHDFGKWTVEVSATEHAAGLEKRVCRRPGCGVENTRVIPARHKSEIAQSYKLVWEDDFDGDTLNKDNWSFEKHDPGWVNAELQEYVDSAENTYVRDGMLYIRPIERKDAAGNVIYEERDGKQYKTYTSGRINTQGKHEFTYGRFEVRAQVPKGKGFLPAFWMMPANESYYGQWPKCGEIDIMEVHGDKLNHSYGTLHFGEPHMERQGKYTLPEGATDFGSSFHTFACEWDPGEFRFYVDDNLFYKTNDWFTRKPGFGEVAYPAPYDQPFYIILNLAVGGSWVGYPEADAEFGEDAQFVVDYVRVYEKDSYDTDAVKPDTTVILRDPDENGNYIINGDFSTAEDLTKEDSHWQILLANGGEAAAEIKDKALHITTTKEGDVQHSVQIVQAELPIAKGAKYELSYEAYADAERTMVTNVTAPDRSYNRYLADTKVTLTTEKQTFKHLFDMTEGDDANGRVEFNLGKQGSTATVHVSNVTLKKAGDADAKDEADFLPDGNYVRNGQFDEGNDSGRLRLAHWDVKKYKGVEAGVTTDSRHELKVVVPENVSRLDQVTVSQEPISITGGKEYVLSFDARGDSAKKVQAQVAGQTFDIDLTTEQKEYRYPFKTPDGLDGSMLEFLLGVPGTTYIDNVSIREGGMIVNGDFSSGLIGYDVYVADGADASALVNSLNEANNPEFSIDISDTGANEWDIQLKQNNIKLEKDKWYELAFRAKSTIDRNFSYALQRDGTNDDNWEAYGKIDAAGLTKDYQDFKLTFRMKKDTDPKTILSISMGKFGAIDRKTKHTICIDDITLKETEAQEEPEPDKPEPGTELITNGDFSKGSEGWENTAGEDKATVSFDNGEAVYDIKDVGTNDYDIQLKHKAPLTLEKGSKYQVSFKIKSTAARTVKYAFLDPTNSYKWYGGEDLVLAADELKEVSYELNVAEATSSDISFCISMGQIKNDQTQELINTPPSVITIDDISVKKVSGGSEEPPVTAEELIQNGNFAKGEENWYGSYIDTAAKATKAFTENKARYEITNAGTADWNVQLKQSGLAMEKGASYKVNLTLGSTIDRDVKFAIMGRDDEAAEGQKDVWLGGSDISLTANKKHTVSRIVKLESTKTTDETAAFQLSMGQIADSDAFDPHAVEIYSVGIIKVEDGTSADEENAEDATITPPAESPEEPTPPEEPGAEMIENGDFSNGETGWSQYIADDQQAEGTAVFTDNKARYEITKAGSADWNVQLKQTGLAMEKATSYKVNLTLGSSIDRDVKLALMGRDEAAEEGKKDVWFGGEDFALKAGKKHSFSRIIKLKDEEIPGDGKLAFQLSMGQIDGSDAFAPHAIEIYNVSITKVADGASADDETTEDVTITPPAESPEEPTPPEEPEELIQNSDFSKGEENWYGSYIDTAATAAKAFTENKARYEITNAGTADWNVQLKQSGLALEKGASYKVNLTLGSTIDRGVKFAIMGRDEEADDGKKDVWLGGADISLTANKKHTVSRIVKLESTKTTDETAAFQLSMGQITDTETFASHVIEIYSVSIIKVEDTASADDEKTEDVTIAPPAEDSNETADTIVPVKKTLTDGEETDPAQEENSEDDENADPAKEMDTVDDDLSDSAKRKDRIGSGFSDVQDDESNVVNPTTPGN